jgi:pimeloyl-ACP methyl ester carboxylesterase
MTAWSEGNVQANGITIHFYRIDSDKKPSILLLNIDNLEPALAAVAQATPWREVISRIQCPILLITGDPEPYAIVTPEVAQEAAHLWKYGEVLHISGAGHNIHRDRYDETMTPVRAFLSRT